MTLTVVRSLLRSLVRSFALRPRAHAHRASVLSIRAAAAAAAHNTHERGAPNRRLRRRCRRQRRRLTVQNPLFRPKFSVEGGQDWAQLNFLGMLHI